MTSSALPSLAEDLHNILNSFGSMLEGVYYIDEDLAGSLAEKFSDRLRESTRSIYAEMTAEISKGLEKPPKKRRRRKSVGEETEDEATFTINPPPDSRNVMGTEELPENENTLLNLSNGEDPDLLAANLLNSDRVTDRSNRPSPSEYDNNNPTMRRIGR